MYIRIRLTVVMRVQLCEIGNKYRTNIFETVLLLIGFSAGILEQSMGARNRVGIGLSYRPARAGIFKESMGARNRVGKGLSYRPARIQNGVIDSWVR